MLQPRARGAIVEVDLEGDGPSELLRVSEENGIEVFRLVDNGEDGVSFDRQVLESFSTTGVTSATTYDFDHDGSEDLDTTKPELSVIYTQPRRLKLFEILNGRFVLKYTSPLQVSPWSVRVADVDIADAFRSLLWLVVGTPVPCVDALDVDDSGKVGLNDPIDLLHFLFLGGREPEMPFPHKDRDPTADSLEVCLGG